MWMLFVLLFASPALAEISPTGFTATWNIPADTTVQYEFRVTNFAMATPLSLGVRPVVPNSLSFTFTSPLPNTTTPDRWECLEARAIKGAATSEWVRACGQVGLTLIPAPPPPKGLVIASQTATQIVITGPLVDCPKGVTTSTLGSTKAIPKRTVTCLK